jgi:hypothetical protein
MSGNAISPYRDAPQRCRAEGKPGSKFTLPEGQCVLLDGHEGVHKWQLDQRRDEIAAFEHDKFIKGKAWELLLAYVGANGVVVPDTAIATCHDLARKFWGNFNAES